MKVIVLYLLATMEPQAVFVGDEQALVACAEVAKTYEEAVGCIPAASENLPYVGVKVTNQHRPRPNPKR